MHFVVCGVIRVARRDIFRRCRDPNDSDASKD
jgi:hypothetical protein